MAWAVCLLSYSIFFPDRLIDATQSPGALFAASLEAPILSYPVLLVALGIRGNRPISTAFLLNSNRKDVHLGTRYAYQEGALKCVITLHAANTYRHACSNFEGTPPAALPEILPRQIYFFNRERLCLIRGRTIFDMDEKVVCFNLK